MTNPYAPPASPTLEPAAVQGPVQKWQIKLGDSRVEAAAQVHGWFLRQGYQLEKGEPADGAYGFGSALLQMLLGAFAKRFLFVVSIESNPAVLLVEEGDSGAYGGVPGLKRTESELRRVREELSALFL